MTADLVVPARFNGPVRSGNGGFVSGSLAERVPGAAGRPVEVTLRRPPPLDRAMTVREEPGTAVLTDGPDLVAEARVVDLDLEAVDGVAPDVAGEAMLGYPGRSGHPFPTACGSSRDRSAASAATSPRSGCRPRATPAPPSPGPRSTAWAAGPRTSRAAPASSAG